jgi:hypothetical protein
MDDIPINAYYQADQKANEILIVNCESQIDSYLKSKIFQLSKTCFNVIKEKYSNTAFVLDNGDFILVTLSKAILVKTTLDDKIRIIGGKQTKINNITSVAIGKNEKSIIVVNNHKNVLVFNQKINGDVGPIRQYVIDKVVSSESIQVDEDKKIINIFDSDKNLVAEFPFNY